jgi:hypothetical protein
VSGWGFSTTRSFHPTRRADRASASPSRGGRSTWKRHGKTRGIPHRDAGRVRALQKSPPLQAKGAARRKAQSDLVSCPVAGTRERLSARHMRSSSEVVAHAICGVSASTGPRFRLIRTKTDVTSATRAQVGRRPVAQTNPSASSWQGLLLVPGGAPAPPGCLICVTRPAGAHLIPQHERLMNAPFDGRGEGDDNGGWMRGDKFGRLGIRPAPDPWQLHRA